jgi:uncharacterized membrane protein YfcA
MAGSVVGALLQAITFVAGIKALLLIVVAFYALSMVTLPPRLKQKEKILSPIKAEER